MVLQKLLSQDTISLKKKGLGSPEDIAAINVDLREFIATLLQREFGNVPAAQATQLESDEVLMLKALAARIKIKTPSPREGEPMLADPENQVHLEPIPIRAVSKKASSVMDALNAMGLPDMSKMSIPERQKLIKEAEAKKKG